MGFFDRFDSPYLTPDDIRPRRRVTLVEYCEEQMGTPRVTKLVAYFRELSKGLVINKTRGRKLIAAFGKDPQNHIGRVIDLVVTMTQFEGESVETIGIEIPEQAPARPSDNKPNLRLDAEAARTTEDDIPF
jgi:hypothetical protein